MGFWKIQGPPNLTGAARTCALQKAVCLHCALWPPEGGRGPDLGR